MNIPIVNWGLITSDEKQKILKRPAQTNDLNLSKKVKTIIENVKKEKDQAVLGYTKEFDQVSLKSLQVTSDEMNFALSEISDRDKNSIQTAIENIKAFHQAQFPKSIELEMISGVRCERRFVPIERVGLYVPGGTAPLPSTVVMLGVPSLIAGCKVRILATPPRKDGSVDPSILVAANLLGIQKIYKIGGAQAIAAMAYGTETISKVDKIFGPGNSWVTEAKLQVSQDAEGAVCDLPAGPSEVMVIADETADPAFVAADLLSQAEHGVDSQVILVCNSKNIITMVLSELQNQLRELPRKSIATESLAKSVLIEVSTMEESVAICNHYAPEHLILQVEDPRKLSHSIKNAGSIFLGRWTPESVGDYASGTNHVLPTYGFARALSGLGTESFMKSITVQELTYEGLKHLAPTVEQLAAIENLDAHRNAVCIRISRGNTKLTEKR